MCLLWFLLVLVVLLTVQAWTDYFNTPAPSGVQNRHASSSNVTMGWMSVLFLLLGIAYATVRQTLLSSTADFGRPGYLIIGDAVPVLHFRSF